MPIAVPSNPQTGKCDNVIATGSPTLTCPEGYQVVWCRTCATFVSSEPSCPAGRDGAAGVPNAAGKCEVSFFRMPPELTCSGRFNPQRGCISQTGQSIPLTPGCPSGSGAVFNPQMGVCTIPASTEPQCPQGGAFNIQTGKCETLVQDVSATPTCTIGMMNAATGQCETTISSTDSTTGCPSNSKLNAETGQCETTDNISGASPNL